MSQPPASPLTDVIGSIPYRMAFAGGWIDQPFVSKLNPAGTGSMVVVNLEPTVRFMERAGMATGTRNIANKLWGGRLPSGEPMELVKQLYAEENRDKTEPSGSQDMIGLIYPGVSRLDFCYDHEGGLFPQHIESCQDPQVARWLQQVVTMIPLEPRPNGYNPLGEKHLDAAWIERLGRSGQACYDAIVERNIEAFGASLNETMACWEAILPNTIHHDTLHAELEPLLRSYQSQYPGAMFSGCGGGYLYVVSPEPVPDGFRIQVRTSSE